MAESDAELLEAWRSGGAAAGERLFDRHYRAVARFFRNKVGDEAADDLIQTTFVGLLEGADRFRGDAPLRSYLFGVAYNTLRKHYQARRDEADRIDFTSTSVHDLAPGPSSVVGRKAEDQLLLAALRRIPVDHQVLLEFYYWEPMTAAEIGRVLGVPEGTVRTRLRRARDLVAAELSQLADGAVPLASTASSLEQWVRSIREQIA